MYLFIVSHFKAEYKVEKCPCEDTCFNFYYLKIYNSDSLDLVFVLSVLGNKDLDLLPSAIKTKNVLNILKVVLDISKFYSHTHRIRYWNLYQYIFLQLSQIS